MNWDRRYDTDGSPNAAEQTAWFDSLSCLKLKLDGTMTLQENAKRIVDAYKEKT